MNRSHNQTLLNMRSVQDLRKPRLEPPVGMPLEQTVVWHQAVDSLPSDWFADEHIPSLSLYCAAVARANQIEVALTDVDPLADIATYDKLVKLSALVGGKVAMFARSMRLTQQARMKAETAHGRGYAASHSASLLKNRPWETDDDAELLA